MRHSTWTVLPLAMMISFALLEPAVAGDPVSLFNGKDLTGWKAEGGARWEVKDGILIGKQGKNKEAGDLFSEKSYDDFELSVTYKIQWPANSGVWYRYQAAKKTYQADILEYKKPFALSGTLYCPGKLFISVNDDTSTINREGWNKLVIRVQGNHHVIMLNGNKVGEAQDDLSKEGRIGFQIHAGDHYEKMRLFVKEVTIKEI